MELPAMSGMKPVRIPVAGPLPHRNARALPGFRPSGRGVDTPGHRHDREPVLRYQAAPDIGLDSPAPELPALVNREVAGRMQIPGGKYSLLAGVHDHNIGVGARAEDPLPGIKAEYPGCILRGDFGQKLPAYPPPVNPLAHQQM